MLHYIECIAVEIYVIYQYLAMLLTDKSRYQTYQTVWPLSD